MLNCFWLAEFSRIYHSCKSIRQSYRDDEQFSSLVKVSKKTKEENWQ